jgi:hypothetical protein
LAVAEGGLVLGRGGRGQGGEQNKGA